MKKLILVALLLAAVIGNGFAGGTKEQSTQSGTSNSAPAKPSAPYFTGDGGKSKGIAILAPTGEGLSIDDAYLPVAAQGNFVTNFTKFSAMPVLDRVSLEKVLAESESGVYSENADFAQLGEITGKQYVMTGKILKTRSGYSLQMQITDTKSAQTAASYTGTCTVAEIDNYTAVKKASEDLLTQMGVTLTDRGRQELLGINTQAGDAETALAKGITAQKNGTVVEALSYYYDAVAFDPSIAEASGRLSVISADITSGNIGENVRNDIQRRNAWKKILDEAETFFQNHFPFEIVYDPTLTQGGVNYEKETVGLSCSLEIKPTDGFKVLETIRKGLVETGKMEEWGFSLWPLHRSNMFEPYTDGYYNYPDNVIAHSTVKIVVGLFNEQGKQLSTDTLNTRSGIAFYPIAGEMKRPLPKGYLGNRYSQTEDSNIVDTTRFEVNDIKDSFSRNYRSYNRSAYAHGTAEFRNVNVNDITDNLTVKIISVNGIDAETAGRTGYMKITSGKVEPARR